MSDLSQTRRNLGDLVAAMLPGQQVIVRESPEMHDHTILALPFVCPDCQTKVRIRLHLKDDQLPVFVEYPRIVCRLLEDQITRLHP